MLQDPTAETGLSIEFDKENPYDPNAIAFKWKDQKGTISTIGHVPKDQQHLIAKELEFYLEALKQKVKAKQKFEVIDARFGDKELDLIWFTTQITFVYNIYE
jgi:hypothetical protein